MNTQGVSIVIPTLNEAGSLAELCERLEVTFSHTGMRHELIVIDDHSDDDTVEVAEQLAQQYPVRVYLKEGTPGKAQSLLEGFARTKYGIVGFIDADLQYPPEAFGEMFDAIVAGYDVVTANRVTHEEPAVRVLMSKLFTYFFVRLLHGLPFDAQAGMKLFRKDVLQEMTLAPTPWTFDLAFLVKAHANGRYLTSVDITFHTRKAGKSKVKLLSSSLEIMKEAVRLRFARRRPATINALGDHPTLGAGIAYRQKRFITHTTLPHHVSAVETFAPWQKIGLALGVAIMALGLVVNPLGTVMIAVAGITLVYFLDVFFNLYLVKKSLTSPPEIQIPTSVLENMDEASLPIYSILCPLYKEAKVLPGFLKAIEALEWPKKKLDVILLLEEDDEETLAVAQGHPLPSYVTLLIVPHSEPKTKPKACNYGLIYARGEYVVIYDAEDVPDPWQLKKAYYAFGHVGPEVRCLQAKLNYFNHDQNLLTRLFTAEYSLWFDVMLTGMQTINTTIPLGGTSNHFRTADLMSLEGWDAFNVTEDCDLGTRLFRWGYKTAVIDSVTLEEANSRLKNWIRQRSRWLKGYLQTYFVHMRHPWQFVRENGWHALAFQFIVGGKVLFILINPIMWLMTIGYFVAYSWLAETIELLFPTVIFAMAAFSLIFGNFLQFYYYMIGCAKRQQWHLMKYVYLLPVYWLITSVAGYVAVYQLLRKPHYWEKTHHGLYVEPLQAQTHETLTAHSTP